MPPAKRAKPTATKKASVEDTLFVRSKGSLRFVTKDWSKEKAFIDVLVDSLARTVTFEHVPLLSVDYMPAKPRGTLAEIKTAFKSGKGHFSLVQGGKTSADRKKTAYLDVVYTGDGFQITTGARGETLAALGPRVLDDFFTIFTTLHDELHGAAHVVCAHAWTDWSGNPREPRRITYWPLRAIADVLEPDRPREERDDLVLDAAQAIAKANPPEGITRATHGGLVMLRCIDDPTDARAALDAALKHEAWLKTIVKNEELPPDPHVYIPDE